MPLQERGIGAQFFHMETQNTAKNFVLQLGSLVALYISISALITLLLGIITVSFPDPAQGYWEYDSASSSIRFAIALLVVFFPTYLILTRLVNNIRRRESGVYLTLTKWLIYLSLFVGGVVLLGDLVAVINEFLNGELTVRFLLKALSILIVVGAAFVYYLLDAKGYWQTHEKKSVEYGIGAFVVVVLALVFGFMHTEAPAEVREMRIDDNQITDLQDMQWRIEEYYRVNETLPESINDLYVATNAPIASEGRKAYEYNKTAEGAFELCAEFYGESKRQESIARPITLEGELIKNPYNWDHPAGWYCFERVVSQ